MALFLINSNIRAAKGEGSYLFGTSINIGAVIPRYNLDAPSFFMIFLKQSNTPVYASPLTALPCCSCIRVFTTSSGYLATLLAKHSNEYVGKLTSPKSPKSQPQLQPQTDT